MGIKTPEDEKWINIVLPLAGKLAYAVARFKGDPFGEDRFSTMIRAQKDYDDAIIDWHRAAGAKADRGQCPICHELSHDFDCR